MAFTKQNLVDHLAEQFEDSGVSRRLADEILGEIIDTIIDQLEAGEEVNLPPLGKWVVVLQKAREARNPQTGETVHVAAKNVPKWRAGKTTKDAVA